MRFSSAIACRHEIICTHWNHLKWWRMYADRLARLSLGTANGATLRHGHYLLNSRFNSPEFLVYLLAEIPTGMSSYVSIIYGLWGRVSWNGSRLERKMNVSVFILFKICWLPNCLTRFRLTTMIYYSY